MNNENIRIKNEYLEFLKATTDKTKRTIEHIDDVLTALIKFIKDMDLTKVKEKDIIEYLNKYSEQAYNPRLSILRTFYRWHLKLEEKEYPEFLKRLKLKSIDKIRRRNKMKYREKIVTEEEYHTLIDNCTKYKHKAIIETLYLFGVRNSELRTMKIKGVEYNEEGNTKIVVYESKTMPRDVIYSGRADHLLTWINNYHPYRNNPENFVFNSVTNKPYETQGIDAILRRTCKNAGLRKIVPHDFRHTSISNDRKNGVPQTFIESNHGLIDSSKMMQVYDHNESKEYEEWLKQRKKEIKPKYELLEKQKKTLEEKHEKEIIELKNVIYTMDSEQEKMIDKIGHLYGILDEAGILKRKKEKIPDDFSVEIVSKDDYIKHLIKTKVKGEK
jgi:site-specific recombinase XerD